MLESVERDGRCKIWAFANIYEVVPLSTTFSRPRINSQGQLVWSQRTGSSKRRILLEKIGTARYKVILACVPNGYERYRNFFDQLRDLHENAIRNRQVQRRTALLFNYDRSDVGRALKAQYYPNCGLVIKTV
ncbi:hypothetical protein pkur_cds_95 [Pandoravirus kuranda]|uniref:Uncharacterized protein n=2 Tax=Pandoravirus TaxID=2060084 RepID=A0AA95ECJ7_9VIRU|nr:hypothetical protein pneo_cds_103 [Pandoravirus neocaledonia]AVK75710.1 hypothetical protein pneo_cds_103 [Pandoravirus neocaledonia]WBR14270.1 hypothetical protein pkur_cds_95 [Pandoravirus kuranda]